ncbi:enoyl-CoA hydratase/isomerase family protein [Actinoplanes bogorensis]|uniref:Enoyl-CoA hydratase/isomerase family protein n=1 Tax=Paractinoplanes bogorensis TaxID=1610840 RepID=A0ABS5YV72_9ACTN|nr:enoyl-CoA hydratase/isomerase family protein [Actinoplanes bogorensis]MBU2667310.1 enoyl-CoA hydratase/isomerase family protein [Actinoplanes bogorensis]
MATLRTRHETGVLYVTFDNPPVNVLDVALMAAVRELLDDVRASTDVRVIVFDSADPEFFLAHVDMTLDPESAAPLAAGLPDGVNIFQGLGELLRHQPQVTIVKLAGLARGGGAEFVVAADLAFAARETAGLGQIEALMGIVPGGGATQYLAQRIGRNRALEVVLGADLFDAGTAERYGWINRALPAAELDAFVDRLARHIAALAPGVIAAAKSALAPADLTAGLRREDAAWSSLITRPAAATLIGGGLKAGAQTREGERDLEGLLRAIA